MLKLLDTDKTILLTQYCVERFGMQNEIFDKYKLYEGSKNKIYLVKKLIDIRFTPESSGLCIFRFDKTPKPTTNFLQLFGLKVMKNVLDIDKDDLLEYCKGNDLEMADYRMGNMDPGFIAIRYNETIIGCAHWNKEIIKNQLPKSRRCKINYY